MSKKSYMVTAWCVRPFIGCIDVEAETPQAAVAKAMNRRDDLLDSAEECNPYYLWDEYSVCDEAGKEVLHVMTDDGKLREAAADLLAACQAALADYQQHIPSATTIPAILQAAIAKAGR
jgi:hypothetical protein